jgi:lipoprotein-releasing system ATP-binding protein
VSTSSPILTVQGLSYRYPEVELFRDLQLTLWPGDRLTVLGPSGSGKTTLLHLLGGLLPLQEGEILWEGTSIRGSSESELAHRRLHFLGFVFQHHYLFPELTALENVLVPSYLAGHPDPSWAQALLDRVGLGDKAHLRPQALSGGERQRVALARALCLKPRLVLADEPTGSLDFHNAQLVISLLDEMVLELDCALILATHDERLSRGSTLRLGVS